MTPRDLRNIHNTGDSCRDTRPCVNMALKLPQNILISETYLDSSISNDDTALSLPGYNLARSDHAGNVERGGVCLYYKEKLSLRMINVSFLSQCVLCEVTLQRQKGYVIVIYRSPSQTAVEFDEFLSNLEIDR